jgi:hypothetical protein
MTTKKNSLQIQPDILEIEVGQVETTEYLSVVNPEFFVPKTGITEEWVGDGAQVTDGKQQKLATLLKLGMGIYTVSTLVDSEGEITSVIIRKV